MLPIGASRCSQTSNSKAFCSLPVKIGLMPIGALKKEEKEKEKRKKKQEKEKDNQYKLKKAMAISIGLIAMYYTIIFITVK